MSDLRSHHQEHHYTTTADFDFAGANRVLDALRAKGNAFLDAAGIAPDQRIFTFRVEARYVEQVWEIEVAVPVERFQTAEDVAALVREFHNTHESIFAIRDENSPIEVITWSLQTSGRIRGATFPTVRPSGETRGLAHRRMYFPETGIADAPVHHFATMPFEAAITGPAVIESSFTTVVINPGAKARRLRSGSLSITPWQVGGS